MRFLKIDFLKNSLPCAFEHSANSLACARKIAHGKGALFVDVCLPCVVCREQHTANTLPWGKWPLPCAPGPVSRSGYS